MMAYEYQSQQSESSYARTNRAIFRPRENTGNPQYDFYTHYSRLSQLDRLSVEQHTVNGNQISRYEPDISHSTACAKAPGFVAAVLEGARELLRGACLVLTLSTGTCVFASADCVRYALHGFDAGAIEAAQTLLSLEATAPEFPALANAFSARVNLRRHRGAAPEVLTVDHSQEVKIAALEYAARRLGNPEDAAEFIRCLHLIAGREPSAIYLQQLASHYYAEAKHRPVGEVLKEMGLLGLEMAAVTATNEQLEFGGEEETEGIAPMVLDGHESFLSDDKDARLSVSERRARWMERAARVLGEDDRAQRGRLFDDEVRAQDRLVYRKSARNFDYDKYSEHLSEVSAATGGDDEFGAYLSSFERAYEQYDEGLAVSLHMSDGERKIACGDLDDDIDEESLPAVARHLGQELRRLYAGGFPLHDRGAGEGVILNHFARDPQTRERVSFPVTVYGIDTWMDAAIDETFGERVARTLRRYIWLPDTKREARQGTDERILHRSRLHEQTETVDVCPNPEERAETRELLEILLQKLRRDYHTRGLNVCATYRDLTVRLGAARDTGAIAALKREAWQHKETGRLSVKLFTAFNTHAIVRQASLEAEPLREARTHRVVGGEGFTMTQTFAEGVRQFIVAQPALNMIPRLMGKTVGKFASALQQLPRQEQERVRREFREENPRLYERVRDGLRAELEGASVKKLCYFRWAFYAGNKPDHPVHTLTREDQAAAWELLKSRSQFGAGGKAETTSVVKAESVAAAVTISRPLPRSLPATRRKQQIVVTRVAASVA